MSTNDIEYRADVEAQIEVIKNPVGDENSKQTAAQRLWMLAEDRDRDVEMYKQKYVIERGAGKLLINMLKDGNDETKWRAARAMVQIAFGNQFTSEKLADLHVIKHIGSQMKDMDRSTDKLKEALLQLVCNVASNNWSCHSTIIRNGILNHVIVLIRSITIPDDVKRAAVNVVYAMTFSPEGRSALMELDAVVVLVPIVRTNKVSVNSMCATLAAANMIGHRERASMLSGCDVPQKVITALDHALNRKPFGGQYNALWKIVMALAELCKSDANKDIIVKCGAVPLLTRMLQLPKHRQSARNIEYTCVAAWHLAFYGPGKAEMCEQPLLIGALQEIVLDEEEENRNNAQLARGALFQLGIIPRPAFNDNAVHVCFSFVEEGRARAAEIGKQVDDAGFHVWVMPPNVKMDEEFTQGVSKCAVMCVCLTGTYDKDAKARTELTFAFDANKPLLILQLDNEGREESWLQKYIQNKKVLDFADPYQDKLSIPTLIKALGKLGSKEVKNTVGKRMEANPSPVTSVADGGKAEKDALADANALPHPDTGASNESAGLAEEAGALREVKKSDAPYRPPAQSTRGIVSAIDSLPPEERERLLATRRVPIETVEGWTVEEVGKWLDRTLQLGQYVKAFAEGGVDGGMLINLSDEELNEQLHVTNKLHRKKVLTRLKQMIGS